MLLSTSTWDGRDLATIETKDLSGLLSAPVLPNASSPDLSVEAPKAVALKIPRNVPRVTSFTFPEAPAWAHAPVPTLGAKSPEREAISPESIASSDDQRSPKKPTVT